MSDLSLKLMGLRRVRPIAEYALWPAYFIIARTINQELFYFTAVFLLLAADLIDSPTRERALFRDVAAGVMTAILAFAINDSLALVAGAIVGTTSLARLSLNRD